MKANHETELLLKSHLNLHFARIKAMAAMVTAIVSARSVQLSVLSRFYGGCALPDSAFKRMQRFLKQVSLPSQNIALLILSILGFEKDEKLTLILDRAYSNYKGPFCFFPFYPAPKKDSPSPIIGQKECKLGPLDLRY